MKYRVLPLGVDIGTSRIRIALAEAAAANDVRIKAVAARDIAEDVRSDPRLVGAMIEEIVAELGARIRACVTSLGSPDATLRMIHFPKMSWHERLRAARYESQRFGLSEADDGTIVRVHRTKLRDSTFAVGVTRQQIVNERVALLRQARLRTIAIDHDAFALQRAIPFADAVLDIGAERSTLHQYIGTAPFSQTLARGGADLTRGIAQELSIDPVSAERRKRILGSAGAGTGARAALVAEFAGVIERARARSSIGRVALVGNGARLPGLASELETACNLTAELIVPPLLQSDAYPEDVIRSAAPDWTLAAALTTWGVAG